MTNNFNLIFSTIWQTITFFVNSFNFKWLNHIYSSLFRHLNILPPILTVSYWLGCLLTGKTEAITDELPHSCFHSSNVFISVWCGLLTMCLPFQSNSLSILIIWKSFSAAQINPAGNLYIFYATNCYHSTRLMP